MQINVAEFDLNNVKYPNYRLREKQIYFYAGMLRTLSLQSLSLQHSKAACFFFDEIPKYWENQSAEATFILLGFSEYPNLQVPLFLLFFTIYIVSVVGNLGMILVIKSNPKLHTPMYYFLRHLSFIDFCNSTIVIPKLLENLVVEDRSITFPECMAQFTLLCMFVMTEQYLLVVMAYDRFVAVCNPLQYTTAMSQKLCAMLVAASYFGAIFFSMTFCSLLFRLSFRGRNIINNFICEYNAIVSVSYSDLYITNMVIIASGNFNELGCLIIIITSYAYIFITVMKMLTARGRMKAFSTCASHLTAIVVFCGTLFFLYCVPNSKNSLLMFMVGNVFYAVGIPMLNPLIYGLRNKVMKETVRKFFHIKLSSDEI
ncbi:olfactory receptor 5D14-like [Sorex araneus]|uniref:olfactory receptor 5D14-like n=1 Tax=Sorex araneus TaxID=42254 RepID=UPI0024334276|nr:olfactory receptor 5D14-like [Sorex araneus]